MAGASRCSICGEPQRRVAHCVELRNGLRPHLLGNRVELLRCDGCGALWCYASHGEEASSPAGLLWPYSVADWQRAYDLDDGISLRRWHLKSLRDLSRTVVHPCGRRVCRFRSRKRNRQDHPDAVIK